MDALLVKGLEQLPALVLNACFMLWLVRAFLACIEQVSTRHADALDSLREAVLAGDACHYYRGGRDERAAPGA